MRKLDVAHDVFHHDHGAVHNHAEVECAERKKIRRNVTEIEKNGGEKKCEGNRDGDDQRAANVPQENKKDQRNQDHAVSEISQNRVHRGVHEVTAVEMGNNFYALGQEPIIQFVDLDVERVEGGVGFGSFAKQDDAFDHVLVVDDSAIFAADCFSELPQTNLGRLHDDGDVPDADGRSIHALDDGGGDVVGRLHQADGAHVELLLAAFDESAARVSVVVSERLLDLGKRQSVRNQFAGIDLHLIFAGRAAEDVDVDNVGHGFQLVQHEPVVESLQFHRVIARIRALEREEHDLAGGAVVRAETGVHVGWERYLLQAVEHFLTRVGGGDFVVVNNCDDRQAGERDRAQMGFVGNPVQGDFEPDGDLLFDLFGGMAGPLRDDLRVSVGDVGIGLDGQIAKRDDAPDEQHQRHAEYQDAIAQGEIDEQTNHLPCSEAAAENASALATSSSPTFAPWRICCRPSDRPAVCTSRRRKELVVSLRKIQSLS